jgi:hypothetical protein
MGSAVSSDTTLIELIASVSPTGAASARAASFFIGVG